MNCSVLNLDDPNTWTNSLRDAVYDESTWHILNDDCAGEKFQELRSSPEYVSDPFIRSLRYKVEAIIRSEYTHIKVFHACRTEYPSAYLKHGILSSTKERLESTARELFEGLPDLEKSIEHCSSYFDMYGGSVSLYATHRFAPKCYLEGSHYLSMLSGRLGEKAHERLSQKNRLGQSVFFVSHLPIRWLEDLNIVRDSYMWSISSSLIKALVSIRENDADEYELSPFAIVVFASIPSENVVSIIPEETSD